MGLGVGRDTTGLAAWLKGGREAKDLVDRGGRQKLSSEGERGEENLTEVIQTLKRLTEVVSARPSLQDTVMLLVDRFS